jgi:hypothetical protein
MRKVSRKRRSRNGLRAEYDFSKGVRGKHASRYATGTNVVVLDADVAQLFPTSASVNDALRAVAELIKSSRIRSRRTRENT